MSTDLQDVLEEATSLDQVRGVYWCARDMASRGVRQHIARVAGNHHFLTFVYADEQEAKGFVGRYAEGFRATFGYQSVRNAAGLTVHYSTLGLDSVDNEIQVKVNGSTDQQAMKEAADSDNRSWYASDLDLEGHRIPPLGGLSDHDLTARLLGMWQDYETTRVDRGVPRITYSLMDENCAALVNTYLTILGYSSEQREQLGEMDGVDWGEEETLQMDFYSAMGSWVPLGSWIENSRRIRVRLAATCRDRQGKDQVSPPLDVTYTTSGDVGNDDGRLVWLPTAAPAEAGAGYGPCVPPGSYRGSSTGITVTLAAECRDRTGGWVARELDITGLHAGDRVTKEDGALVVQAS